MEKIPTAKELIETDYYHLHLDTDSICLGSIETAMIEFAKLHVEAALKEAAHESQCYNKAKFSGDENWVVDIDSILNSYPLDQIK